jgi:sucrose-6F-phosphate phosphohydrolase
MRDASTVDKKMICADLDGTFIGDDDAMYELLGIIDSQDFLLAFSTGRHLRSTLAFIDEKIIRKPDACICLVGTEVYFLQKGELTLDNGWSQIISEGWDREKIVRLLADIKELLWQDEEWQTRFKISYFLRENQDEVLKEIIHRLEKAKLKAVIIYSCGEFLDFLPLKSSKAGAIKYIIDKFNLKKRDVVVCGDSGNDLDMFALGFKGIIVGNARPELKSFNGENAYHAVAQYSAGIIEGLKHFGLI